MQPLDYPPQEAFSPQAQLYHDEVTRRGRGSIGEEVPYGPDPYQGILFFRPERPNGTMLAFVHGGGWTNGYKEWMAFMAPCFNQAGVTFASVGYRLAPGYTFPTGFEDVCSGISCVSKHARSYGADPARLFVGGHSAGGHYAALAALTRPALNIRGCLPLSGVFDFGSDSGLNARPRFLGALNSDAEVAASPIAKIGSNLPPFLIAYGSDDFPHLVLQGEGMARALAKAGCDVTQLVLEGRNHFTASYAGGEPAGPWVPTALEWMARR
jgi:acetyl esterase/lipase